MRTVTTGNYAGVGLAISKLRDPQDKELPYVYVMNAFEGYAYDAGIRVGDKILTVDGKDLRESTVTGTMMLSFMRVPVWLWAGGCGCVRLFIQM
jgi:C-terminal processing protease CtpA/Prc